MQHPGIKKRNKAVFQQRLTDIGIGESYRKQNYDGYMLHNTDGSRIPMDIRDIYGGDIYSWCYYTNLISKILLA